MTDDVTEDKFGLGKINFSEEQIAEMMSPALALKKAQEKKHRDFMIAAMDGDLEDNAGPYKLRCVVERDTWYVPVKSDGEFEILNVRKGEYPALIARVSKKDGRRTDREGQGGQMLPIYQEKPDGPCTEIDGRCLARALPSGISGLLVQDDLAEPLRELYAEHFTSLRGLADAVEIEDALMADGPVDTTKLLNYKFRVAMYNKRFASKEHAVPVATFDDTQYFDDEFTVEMMTGKELFEKVLQDGTYGGIIVNRGSEVGRNGQHLKGLLLSMNFIERALKNQLCEIRVPAYVVRSREEFELWLKHVFFPVDRQEIIEERDGQGRTFVHAVSRAANSEWNIRECEWTAPADEVATPKFEIRPDVGTPDEIGKGLSPVLCPGLIAKQLWMQLPEKDRRDNKWCPGRSVGIGRQLSDEDVAKSQLRVRLANELLKFIPAGADSLPPTAMRSVAGARFVEDGWCPAGKTCKWAESAREQAERYARKFILGFGA